jgi:predicted dehydrogenase
MKKTRRSFVKKIAGGAIAASAAPQILIAKDQKIHTLTKQPRKVAANDKIRIGAIATGIMGLENIRTALMCDGVELVAACDLYDGRLERTKELYGKDIFTTRDYKEILDRDDIDAVINSTPDHWHDHISIAAMEKGKSVYHEKPMVQHLDEGQAVIESQKKSGKVFQVGAQWVSSIVFLKAKELYESGAIGKLVLGEAIYDRQSSNGAWQYSIPRDASEKTIDWKAFLGDAPKMKFDPIRFFRWRNYRDYGTGVAGDLFVHLIGGVHMITSSYGPNRIFSSGGLRYWTDGRDVPDVIMSIYDYPETDKHPAFNMQLRVNFIDGSGGGTTIKFVGTEGTLQIKGDSLILKRSKMPENPGYGGWDSYETFSTAQQKEYAKWYKEKYPEPTASMSQPGEEIFRAPEDYYDRKDHWQIFFDSMRSGEPLLEDAEFGFRAAAPALATNMSYFDKKIVNWDPVGMKVV